MPRITHATRTMAPISINKNILIPDNPDGFGSSTWSRGGSKNDADGEIFERSSDTVCKIKY